jgi:hypothetical protein
MNSFWTLRLEDFVNLEKEGDSTIGTVANRRDSELYDDFGMRPPGSGVFICWGSVTLPGSRRNSETEAFPVCIRRATIYRTGDQIQATVSDNAWEFHQGLETQLWRLGIAIPSNLASSPSSAIVWLQNRLSHSGARVEMKIGYLAVLTDRDSGGSTFTEQDFDSARAVA